MSAFIESFQSSNKRFSEILPRPEVELDGVVHLTERRGGDVADVVAVVHVGRGGGQDGLREELDINLFMQKRSFLYFSQIFK